MNNRLFSLVLLLLLALSGCAANESYIPAHLTVRNGGSFGPSYTVVLDGDTLIYKVRNKTEAIERTRPTLAQWKAFRKELDEIDVWHWRNEYFTEGVLDGNVWQFEVEYSDRAIKSIGHEGYPQGDGSPSAKGRLTAQYKRHVNAIRILLGGRQFCCG
jgi:hypothetical protein